MLLIQALLFLFSFFTLWLGSGLIVRSVDNFSKNIQISRFAVSFFILGILTSLPEFAIGITALAENNPEIYIGNLIGGIPVIFFFIIPLLAILGNGIRLSSSLDKRNLLLCFLVVIAPTFLLLDQTASYTSGFILIILYITLFFFIQKNNGILSKEKNNIFNKKLFSYKEIFKIIVGIIILFVSSNIIVNSTIYFSNIFLISPFIISLLVLSLGSNLPELSIAIRSVILGKNDIALGDYLGSAAANTFLFGLFTILNFGRVITIKSFVPTFIIVLWGLALFFYFSRSNNDISRKEGIFLMLLYFLFISLELSTGL